MDYVKLLKEVSYALRHAPWEYELDENGFVLIEQLLNSLNSLNEYGRNVTREDLEYIIANSDKKDTKLLEIKLELYTVIQFLIKLKKYQAYRLISFIMEQQKDLLIQ